MKLFMLAPTVLAFPARSPLAGVRRGRLSRRRRVGAGRVSQVSIDADSRGGDIPRAAADREAADQAWVGSSVQPSTLLLTAAAVWAVLTCVSAAYAVFLNGVGILRLQVVLAVLMMTANLGLSIVFTMRIGISGVIWGSVVAQAFLVLLPLTVYLARWFSRLEPGCSS